MGARLSNKNYDTLRVSLLIIIIAIWLAVVLTHCCFFTVVRNSCEDDEIHYIDNKFEQEYPVSKSIPFVFQQFIEWLNLEHLETILK